MDPALLENVPVIPPPPGVVSNFVDPETRSPIFVAFIGICLGLTWSIFLLRLYTKIFMARKFSSDDVTSSIAIIGLSVMSGFIIWQMTILGPHGWDIPMAKITTTYSRITILVTAWSSNIVVFFTKLSLLLLYLHMFAPKVWLRYAVYAGIIACGLVYGGITISVGVLCFARPGESWTEAEISPRCTQLGIPQAILTGVFSLLSDLYLFILPIPIIWHLHLSTRKKMGVAAVFSTGFFAIIASAIGVYYRVGNSFGVDPVWDVPAALLLAVVEISVGILCASMPYLPPIFRKVKDSKIRSPFNSARSLFARFTLHSSHYNRSREDDQTPVFQQHKVMVNSGEDVGQYEYEFDQIRLGDRAQQVHQV